MTIKVLDPNYSQCKPNETTFPNNATIRATFMKCIASCNPQTPHNARSNALPFRIPLTHEVTKNVSGRRGHTPQRIYMTTNTQNTKSI